MLLPYCQLWLTILKNHLKNKARYWPVKRAACTAFHAVKHTVLCLCLLRLEVPIGVGVHTGKAFVGSMGSTDFANYTAIGDNVNLVSRLEGLCPQYGVGIVVSGEVREACASIAFASAMCGKLRFFY